MRLLQSLPGSPHGILLVGHKPDLSRLASLLLTGGDDLAIDFKKGAIAKLAAENLRAGRCAALKWFLTPGQFGRMI